MRTYPPILLLSVLTIFLVSNSYAQDIEDPSRDVYISVQTFVRDSDGNLVYYFENDKFTHKFFIPLNKFLDFEASKGNDPCLMH